MIEDKFWFSFIIWFLNNGLEENSFNTKLISLLVLLIFSIFWFANLFKLELFDINIGASTIEKVDSIFYIFLIFDFK